ncbi:palmitoyl-monogalactosyldiacylglycerol delta-7 desaturase, chloroplastic-like [Rosa rugosa]|uniref:palmitoyl-monogalactosyldiacylglycerol delta-7 desaturase, chloroplastic-like n=1 Tax=Rosa rugosa TaxID=74645 RepID=UPI002B412199|nr:palmitoyl-monogalactosyldiacylglycerol delta-7 desaturase, chloroplastic-like [Rosa rugosa]
MGGLLVSILLTPFAQFLGRSWNLVDIIRAATFLAPHVLCLFAPFYFTWAAFWVAAALYILTGLGVTLGFHRHLAHKSLRLPRWLEYLFAYFGALSLQGSPIEWVSTHRYHHQFTDTERDPHSPLKGFWFSHVGWIFDSTSRYRKNGGLKNVEDMKKQWFYRFLHRTYLLHIIVSGASLYALGGLPFFIWGMGVRTVYVFHFTLLVNSAGHIWGKQVWNTGDLSKNNWWLGWIALGEGWHNNHHAFEYSARQGLEWWQVDLTWYVITALQALGLATDVRVPTESQMRRKALKKY